MGIKMSIGIEEAISYSRFSRKIALEKNPESVQEISMALGC